MRTILMTAALGALLVAVSATAGAQESPEDAAITQQAKEHYKLGLDAFKAGRYPDAIKELKKAYLLKRLPPLLINIAKTYEKLNDVDNEIYYYKKYLAEAPPDAKDRDQVKQTIKDLEDQKAGRAAPKELPMAETPSAEPARPSRSSTSPSEGGEPRTARTTTSRRPAAEGAGTETAPAPTPAPASTGGGTTPTEWAHTPIDAVPPNKPVDVRVSMPVMKGVKVYLYYRGKGQADFASLEMKRHGAEKMARIPAQEVQGTSIQYYIEAKDSAGAVVKSSGSQTDPNIVMIDAKAPAQFAMSSKEREEEPGVEGEQNAEPEPPPPPRRKVKPTTAAPPSEEEDSPQLGGGPDPHRSRPVEEGPRVDKPSRKLGRMALLGYALMGGGAVVAGVGGGVGFYYASAYSQAVRDDACPTTVDQGKNCPNTGPFIFNDPRIPDNDKSFQDRGKLANLMGIVGLGVGGAMLATGVALVIVDYVKSLPPAPKRVPRKRRRPVQEPVDDMPTDAAPAEAPPETSSLMKNFVAAPIVTSNQVGLGAGFAF